MKKFTMFMLALLSVGMIGLSACGDTDVEIKGDKDSTEQKMDNAVNDAEEAAKKAAENVENAAKEAGEAVDSAAEDVKDAVDGDKK